MTGFQFDDLKCPRIHLTAAANFDSHTNHALGVEVEGLGIEGSLFVFHRWCPVYRHIRAGVTG